MFDRTTPRATLAAALLVSIAALLLVPRAARADCDGPAACCVADPAHATTPLPTRARLGMRLMRLRSVSDEAGTFNAEIALLLRWPAGGLRPEPRPRNAGSGYNVVLDETRLIDGVCYREQRLQGDFQTWFRLRRFPFDVQELRLHFEERRFLPEQLTFEPVLWPNVLSFDAVRELSGWRFDRYPELFVRHSSFSFPASAPRPQLLVVAVPIRRLSEFYLTRYFLPLLVIVALAYGLFWIRPDDLGSSASVGVTCLLAIITFQITQSGELPHVAYLTIADRVYVVCYLATALAIATAVRGAFLVADGRVELARKIDKRWRWLFPLLLATALAGALGSGWRAGGRTEEAPQPPAAPSPPRGEPAVV